MNRDFFLHVYIFGLGLRIKQLRKSDRLLSGIIIPHAPAFPGMMILERCLHGMFSFYGTVSQRRTRLLFDNSSPLSKDHYKIRKNNIQYFNTKYWK